MTARRLRGLMIFGFMPLCIGLAFQNCSPASFKQDEAELATTEAASMDPNAPATEKLCDDGAANGNEKWARMAGENFEEPGQCAFGGTLTLIYEKNQKQVCENGKYTGKNEFKKGNLIGQKGACNCEGGVVHGMSTWKVLAGQTLTEMKACPASGTLNLFYEKEQKYTCDNGKLLMADVFQKGKFLRQEGACKCADGSAEGSSSYQIVPNSTIPVPGVCTYGGNLLSLYEKLQQYVCMSSQMMAQSNFIKGKLLSTTGACNPPPVLTETFNISATKSLKPMDMIWVVDNSGSMVESAANVRKNIGGFISSVDSNLDMKFLMVSEKGTVGTGVVLPAGLDPSRFMHIDLFVTSSKPAVAAIGQLDAFSKKGTPFFRAGSKKMIVFVTDDESSISANTFMSELARFGVGPTDVSIFGFIGMGGAASPCQSMTGNTYLNLAAQTNGKVFNVCQIDWTQYFVDLKTEILTKLGRTFNMKAPVVAKITKIEVDGVILNASTYSFLNGVISLSENVKLTELSVVKVFYTQE